jgi:hypothetical protein
MDIKQQTQNVANQGRYGDSMLLHVNPAEVKGLAQAMPITVNPETGQPEAFLPFLAPLLGSALGTTFLTGLGGAGIAGAGISSALAAGLGAGAATYLQSGGSGSKALLSGLTAGFGTNALNTGAQSSQLAGNIATQTAADTASAQIAQGIADGTAGQATTLAAQQAVGAGAREAATQAATNAAISMPRTATGPLQATKDIFAGGFDQGAKSLATGLMSPSGMMAGTALGGSSIINSQELYEQQMRQFEEDEEQRRRDMYANNPEIQLYSASGGVTGFEEGGFVSSIKSSARNLADRLSDDQFGYESSRQVYAPAKQQYAVNPDFMAGFAPETMYFRPDTINSPSMSTLGGSAPTLGPDTYTGTKGGYDYEGTVDADGNYTAGTAQGVQFAPQTSIDPYAAFTGSAPQGLVQSAYNPYPVQPMSMSPIDDTEDTSDYGGIGGGDYDGDQGYFSDLNLMGGNMGGFDPTSFMGASGITNQYIQNQQIQEYLDSLNNPTTDIGDAFTADGPMGKAQGGVTNYANQGQIEMMSPPTNDFRQDPITQEVIAFLMGDSENTEVVEMFVDKYGNETFMALREMILNPDGTKQTEGLIAGVGNGGMDDDLLGSIGNKEKIAVSQDEFIIPADVVSGLGDGSSNAGSKELYAMMDRIRQKRTGTTKQPTMLANAGGLLPA